MTQEDLEREEREFQQRSASMQKARKAIVDSLGGPWKRGMEGYAGLIECPVCNQLSSLRFRRAGYNGHIHARCATEGCVSWME